MARVLLILSIILTLATAGVGYMAKQKVDELQTDAQKTKRTLKTTTDNLTKTKKELDVTTADLAKTKTDLDDRIAELGKAKTELNDTSTKLATATADVERMTKELAEMQIPKADGGPQMTAEEIRAEREANRAELEKTKSALAEAQQVQETLNNRLQEQVAQVTSKQREVDSYRDVTKRAGLRGQITGFNPGWNFAVLNIGDKAGLKSGQQMVVMRGGSMIAKVRVTTVEPNTAIADVLPGTIARGSTVQAGDTVVFEGNQR